MDIEDILFYQKEGRIIDDIAANPPIFQTSNFVFGTLSEMKHALKHEDNIPFYTRGSNPTISVLEQKIASLEHTESAMIFSSGSSAIATAVISTVSSGDHIVCVENPYSWTKKLLEDILGRFGVESSFIKGDDSQGVIDAVRPNTKLIFLESPISWTFEMQDISKITSFAKENKIYTIIDNSCASPLYQQPVKHGVDIVVHSATKYLNGHSDIVAGAICTSHEIRQKIFKREFMTFGSVISPMNAWLMIRSLRTFPLRMEKISANALEVAKYLDDHPKVQTLYYTHSKNFPQPELVKNYLSGAGGLMTIDIKTDNPSAIEAFCNKLKRFKLGCSWGGYESLAFPALTTLDSLNYNKKDTFINRIRLYIGLDSPDKLIADLANAFEEIPD